MAQSQVKIMGKVYTVDKKTGKTSSPSSSKSSSSGSSSSSSSNQISSNIGTYIDAKTGEGYSGVQKSPFDLPASGSTSTTYIGSTPVSTSTSKSSSSRGGSSSKPAPVDASFTSGGSATGQGGSTFDSATNSSSVNMPSPKPNTISAGGELSSYAGTYKQSFGSALKQSIGIIGSDIGIAIGGKAGEYENPLNPFKSTGMEKSEEIAYYKPNFGTIQTTGVDMNTGKLITTGVSTPVTYLDIQKERELKRSIELSQVGTGEEAQKKVETIYAKYPDVQGFTTRSGAKVKEFTEAGLETAGLIGLSLAGPTGAAAASAYVLGSGFKQTVEAPTLGGKAMGIATAGLGLYGFGATTSAIERSIIAGEIESLSSRPIKFNQIQIVKGDQSSVLFQATQKQGGLTRTMIGRGDVFQEGKNMFILPKGNIAVKTTGNLGWNFYGQSKTLLYSEQIGSFGTKGATKNVGDFVFSVSKSTYVPKSSMSTIYGLDIPKKTIKGFSTNVKLGGESITSYSFSSSKRLSQDAFGRERYFTAGFGIKNGKPVKPAQFGVTLLVEGKEAGSKYAKEVFTDFKVGKIPKSKKISSSMINLQVTKTETITPITLDFGKISYTAGEQIMGEKVKIFRPRTISKEQPVLLKSKSYLPQQLAIKNYVGLETGITTRTKSGPSIIDRTVLTSGTRLNISTSTATMQEVSQLTTPISISPITFPTPFIPAPTIPFRFFPISTPSMEFEEGKRPSRTYKRKRKLRYTPSYEAVIFGIKGKKPRGVETGARIRPLTKDFKPFKMPSFKLNFKGGKF